MGLGFFGNKFRVIRQSDATQCGVACLSMICKFYNCEYSLKRLNEMCPTTIEGVSLKSIVNCAKKIGFSTLAARVDLTQLVSMPVPCILHWDNRHFVVLYKVKRDGYKFKIADPAVGKYELDKTEFLTHWIGKNKLKLDTNYQKGVALFLEPVSKLKSSESKSDVKAYNLILGYLKEYWKYTINILIGLIVACLLNFLIPFLTQSIVDIGIGHKDIGFIWLVVLGELMILIGRTSVEFVKRWMMVHISNRVHIRMVSDFWLKLLDMPMRFFEIKPIGDLTQRIADHARIQKFLTREILNICFSIMTLSFMGIVLFIYDKTIFTVFLIWASLYSLWICRFMNKRKILDYKLFDASASNNSIIYQFLTSIKEIKLQGCGKQRRWEWEDVQVDLFRINQSSLKLHQMQESGSIFLNEIKNIIITVFAATAVINDQLTIGAMMAIQSIVGQLNFPVSQLMGFIYSCQEMRISLERVNEIHKTIDEKQISGRMRFVDSILRIRLENISFRYDNDSNLQILECVSMVIPNGKVTAIVGESGSGKSTLLKLLLGFYFVQDGSIAIGKTNIKDLDMEWWRKQWGVVMQDSILFFDTIARNIAIGDDEIDTDKMIKAAKIANIHEFISDLPLKYATIIGKGGYEVSLGQKQRILIARIVYKNPPYVILDEATNSLDTENEMMIMQNLQSFFRGKTVVLVAHRLSTIKNADQIAVLKKGNVVECGTHGALIKTRGYYYELVKNQLEMSQ